MVPNADVIVGVRPGAPSVDGTETQGEPICEIIEEEQPVNNGALITFFDLHDFHV